MMQPLYFPFTTISGPVLGALLTCFERVTLYHPSLTNVPESLRNWEAKGCLQIHLPDDNEKDPLPELLKAYHAWGDLHAGERPDFEKFRPPLTPFTDPIATSRIRSDIRKAASATENAPSPEDEERSMLLRARLFLTIAQEHDQLRQALREDLESVGRMEKELFQNLISGVDEPFTGNLLNQPAGAYETDRYMPGERMAAWACLHLHYRKSIASKTASAPEMPFILVTSDQFALDQLLAPADGADLIWSVSDIPFGSAADASGNVFFNEQRCEKLRKLATESGRSALLDAFVGNSGNKSENTGRLDIYRVEGDAVANFLSESSNRSAPLRMKRSATMKEYSLVGCIK